MKWQTSDAALLYSVPLIWFPNLLFALVNLWSYWAISSEPGGTLSYMDPNHASALVIAAVDDLFFATKIESAAERLGITIVTAVDYQQLCKHLNSLVPDTVILDLNSRACAPLEALRHIKSDARLSSVWTIGFVSHVQTDLQKEAKEAGCDQVVARSAFSARLPQYLMRNPKP